MKTGDADFMASSLRTGYRHCNKITIPCTKGSILQIPPHSIRRQSLFYETFQISVARRDEKLKRRAGGEQLCSRAISVRKGTTNSNNFEWGDEDGWYITGSSLPSFRKSKRRIPGKTIVVCGRVAVLPYVQFEPLEKIVKHMSSRLRTLNNWRRLVAGTKMICPDSHGHLFLSSNYCFSW